MSKSPRWWSKTLRQSWRKHWPFLVIAVCVTLFLLGALVRPPHILLNLEPYPDALMYLVPPYNFVQGNGWQLLVADEAFLPNVPPLYSLSLVPFFFLFRSISSFVLLNLVLLVGVLWFFYRTLQNLTKSQVVEFLGLVVLLSHLVLVWYATLPMSELMGLVLLAAALYLFSQRDWPKQANWLAVLAGLLLLTRYTLYPVALMVALVVSVKLLVVKKYRLLLNFISILAIFVIAATVYQFQQGEGPLYGLVAPYLNLAPRSVVPTSATETAFVSPAYIWPNLNRYFGIMSGRSDWLLWHHWRVTSLLVLMAGSFGWVVLLRRKPIFAWISMVLFISLLVLILPFYVVDVRYILPAWLFICMWATVALIWLSERKGLKFTLIAGGLIVGSLLLAQLPLMKTLLTENVLRTAQPWQYLAVKEVSSQLDNEDRLITALPPHYVNLFSENNLVLLPLSPAQEFMQKGIPAWGSNVPYEDLLTGYQTWLEEGRELFITNAYITHQQAVIDDYEAFKTRFDFELVSEGCQGVCNLYQLQLKNTE